MNEMQNYYIIKREEFNENTLVREDFKFSGPYTMYTEYDLENLNYI